MQAQGKGWDSEGTRSSNEAAAGAQRWGARSDLELAPQYRNPLFQSRIGVRECAGGRGEGGLEADARESDRLTGVTVRAGGAERGPQDPPGMRKSLLKEKELYPREGTKHAQVRATWRLRCQNYQDKD